MYEDQLTAEQKELLALLMQEEGEDIETEPNEPSSSLVAIRAEGIQDPLFFVGVFQFRKLAQYLDDRPVYGLLGQNLDRDGAYMQRVEEMAEGFVKDVRTVQKKGPYNLSGFCFGGLVAFEMARQLRAQGEEIGLLAMIDTYSPYLKKARALERTLQEKLAYHRQQLTEQGLSHLQQWMRGRATFEWNQQKKQWSSMVGKTYLRLGKPVPERMVGVITSETNRQAARRYAPSIYEGDVTLFRCVDEQEPMTAEQAEALGGPMLGWGPLVSGEVRVVEVPGNHLGALEEPYVQVLAERLQAHLKATSRATERQKAFGGYGASGDGAPV